MQIKQAIGALLQIIVVLFLCSVAALLIFIEKVPYLRYQAADLLIYDPASCRLAGFGFLFAACLMYAVWMSIHRKKTIHVKMGDVGNKISLRSRLFKNALAKYMDQTFPNRFSIVRIDSMDGKKIEICLRSSPGSLPVDEELLLKMEQEFSHFLTSRLGYKGEFFLRIDKEAT